MCKTLTAPIVTTDLAEANLAVLAAAGRILKNRNAEHSSHRGTERP